MAPVASSAPSSSSSPPPDNSGTFLQFDVVMQQQEQEEEPHHEQREGEGQHGYQMKMRAGEETTITIPATNITGYNSSSYSTSSSSTSSSVSSPSPFTSGFAAFGGTSAVPTEFSLSASELLASMSPLSAANDAPMNIFMKSYKSRVQQDQLDEMKLQVVTEQPQSPPVKPEPPTILRKSVSPKRERATSTITIAADASLSSQHEEDSLSSDSSTTKKVFKCTFPGCGKEFQLKGNLKRHQNIHNGDKKFRCKFCGKDFLRKADMEVHHRVHTGEKPYKCKFPDCDKCFARRSDLLSHERTHIGTKPFACLYPGCGRHFARKFDLQKHQRMHDNHSSECQKRRKISSPSSDDCNCWPADPPPSPMMDEFTRAVDQKSPAVAAPAPAAAPPTSITNPSVSRYQQLTCTQDHIHSPPACFAAFTPDLLDNFLLSSREVFDSKPYPGCCGSVGDGGEISAGSEHSHAHRHHNHNHQAQPSIKQQFEALVIIDDVTTKPELPTEASQSQSTSSTQQQQPMTGGNSSSNSATAAKRPRSASASSSSSTNSCPMDAELLKDYAKHTPSCGHLSILHGNHRDYVVKNHLVCQDSVRSIGGGENHSVKPAKCPVDEPHRPGCGHLPVRHRDHIDYVVEDNLFCQQAAGMLDAGADNIELLDDDFWEFYGAIGSLNTD